MADPEGEGLERGPSTMKGRSWLGELRKRWFLVGIVGAITAAKIYPLLGAKNGKLSFIFFVVYENLCRSTSSRNHNKIYCSLSNIFQQWSINKNGGTIIQYRGAQH